MILRLVRGWFLLLFYCIRCFHFAVVVVVAVVVVLLAFVVCLFLLLCYWRLLFIVVLLLHVCFALLFAVFWFAGCCLAGVGQLMFLNAFVCHVAVVCCFVGGRLLFCCLSFCCFVLFVVLLFVVCLLFCCLLSCCFLCCCSLFSCSVVHVCHSPVC